MTAEGASMHISFQNKFITPEFSTQFLTLKMVGHGHATPIMPRGVVGCDQAMACPPLHDASPVQLTGVRVTT